jgi:ABC-type Fe3+ transport system substrate-binding protein
MAASETGGAALTGRLAGGGSTVSLGVAAAIVAGSGEVDNAKRLIAFLSSPQAATAIIKSGMEPMGGGK